MPLPKKNMSPIQAMRVNNPLFSLLLALPLIAAGCGGSVTGSGNGNGSNSTGANGFTVVSVSVAQSQIWQINRAIDIRFTRAVDFSTVGLNTISIATPSGLSATGSFSQVDVDTVLGCTSRRVDATPETVYKRLMQERSTLPQTIDEIEEKIVGKIATLVATGRRSDRETDKVITSRGKITLVKEDGTWRIRHEAWQDVETSE